ncbi:Hypothetical predicted protein [Paramuricea clavata]|uniref:Uncharacterized protein n=1 Tax=Paramuricea clavata TaxID=317549 RepID=A0A6S7IS01_PARCT|nr:Hypothetical predicted protein [Paramuricea clavata]
MSNSKCEGETADISGTELTKRAKYLCRLTDSFWEKWHKEYLLSLREQHRGSLSVTKETSINIGDVVSVHDENRSRAKWCLARVHELIRSTDGKIRAAVIRIAGDSKKPTYIRRPVQKLFPLELRNEHTQKDLLNPTKQSPKSLKSYTPSYITKRDCRPANKQALITTLSQINWTPLYHVTALDDQFNLFSNKLSSVIDSHLPLRTIKCYPKDKPWITADIKKFISKRQKAWLTSNTIMYNVYRNKVRKLCKSAHQCYYDKKILNTSESNPQKWYDDIKSISGLSKSEPFSSIFHDGEFKRGPELAELIAESFCSVSNELAPLCFNKLHITSVPDEYIISTQQVEIELEKISLQKAIGPDNIPNWSPYGIRCPLVIWFKHRNRPDLQTSGSDNIIGSYLECAH